ncbi:hypothetical protein Q9L58_001957 [Maublancomyces gigas]|uniref:Ubiquitin 3 binding protein But2 C-terminal domain-containing protein n=1 Tax=Discina gigas TaxID=1032678 RepID=A0ABR3GT42_9PEZI
MRTSFLTSIVALFGLALSSPVDTALAARAAPSFYPTLVINISSPDRGSVSGDVYVHRSTAGGIQYQTNSLIAFPIPSGYSGKTCSFSFNGGWPISGTPNSKRVQLFSVGGPITATNTYTKRPYRNVWYGSFRVSDDGATATWDGPTPTFPCPAAATTLGFEVVPEGDFDEVEWGMDDGLAIVVL